MGLARRLRALNDVRDVFANPQGSIRRTRIRDDGVPLFRSERFDVVREISPLLFCLRPTNHGAPEASYAEDSAHIARSVSAVRQIWRGRHLSIGGSRKMT